MALRLNFNEDDNIEQLLLDHLTQFNVSQVEQNELFSVYTRRIHLKRFLAHYELYRQVKDLPGDIIELGVYNGSSLMSWANFLEIFNMGDRQKQVFGFDDFKPFQGHAADENRLRDAIDIFDKDRFIPYKPRVKVFAGDILQTLPLFIRDTPGLRLNLVHFDCDYYEPTKLALELLWPLVVKGGICIFDEYGIKPWGGESNAVDDFFKDKTLHKFPWAPNPGGWVVK